MLLSRGVSGLRRASIPSVTAVVPCRNEAAYIETCLRSLLDQEEPPGGIEVLAVDGLSEDGTREIITRLAAQDSRLTLVDNPRRITPCGMNVGIRASRSPYVAILGAHAEYARDYLRQVVLVLDDRPDVACAGGPIESRGRSLFGRATALAMSHPLGVGNAKHRFPQYEGYAEGACYPVFRKAVIEKLGLYDERLLRNQDDELNLRLAQAGERVYLTPKARSVYYVRDTPGALFRQYFDYGLWRVAVLRKHGRVASLRQLVPAGLVVACALSLGAPLVVPAPWSLLLLAVPAAYATGLLAGGIAAGRKHGRRLGARFPAAVAILHWAYGLGFLTGLPRFSLGLRPSERREPDAGEAARAS